mmetsp:Transcript_60035/g.166180  ORF Transcript_60035/g.166180 Transcript_60035/m.166180 type:complete len:370 (-) Transcript_60035:137-1246(-)
MHEDGEVGIQDEHADTDPSCVEVDPLVVLQVLQLLQRRLQALVLVHVDGVELLWAGVGPSPLGAAAFAAAFWHEVQAPAGGGGGFASQGGVASEAASREAGPSLQLSLGVRAEPAAQLLANRGVPGSVAIVGLRVPGVAVEVCEDGVRPPGSGERAQVGVLRAAEDLPPPDLLDLNAPNELVVPQHAVSVLFWCIQGVDKHRDQGLLHVEVPVIGRVYVPQVLVAGSHVHALEFGAGEHAAELALHHGGVADFLMVQHRHAVQDEVHDRDGELEKTIALALLRGQEVLEVGLLDHPGVLAGLEELCHALVLVLEQHVFVDILQERALRGHWAYTSSVWQAPMPAAVGGAGGHQAAGEPRGPPAQLGALG